jgi:hypothetical protein
MMKISPRRLIALIAVGWLVVLVGIPLSLAAYRARRPSDMPANSIWIDAPAVPFGFYRGWWLGCWDDGQHANRCRLYSGSLNPPVVYEGRYLPCEGKSPIPPAELNLKAPVDSSEMWVFPGVIVFLQDGRLLVPVENFGDCDKIRNKAAKSREKK